MVRGGQFKLDNTKIFYFYSLGGLNLNYVGFRERFIIKTLKEMNSVICPEVCLLKLLGFNFFYELGESSQINLSLDYSHKKKFKISPWLYVLPSGVENEFFLSGLDKKNLANTILYLLRQLPVRDYSPKGLSLPFEKHKLIKKKK